MDTLDVEACPGSGKTTLLVAKLAILARKWTDGRRGLCVLSHTNVARREIEAHLGNTTAGRRLLGHPHFIGTIHGFVNEFLALPWLRSLGYPVEMIDDHVCLRRRWRCLEPTIRSGLEKNRHTENILRFRDAEFGLGEIKWSQGILRQDTRTYQAMSAACALSARDGYFCHDEMFVWAHDMLDKVPNAVDFLRIRFPLLFIDEAQDNSGGQAKILHRVFMGGRYPVTRQRFGDSNQAIYQFPGHSGDHGTDVFPLPGVRTDMPNSFRFDQSVANLADPLAVVPQGLQGLRDVSCHGKHVVFLFDKDTIGHVLDRYAQCLTDVFSRSELRDGIFTAVGAVHRPGRDDKVPASVNHYWSEYDHEIGSRAAQPKRLVQYVLLGRRLAQRSGEANALVERVADGVLHLSRLAGAVLEASGRTRRHRRVLPLLEDHSDARQTYLDLIRTLCVDGAPLTRTGWNERWREAARRIAIVISGGPIQGDAVCEFLSWADASDPLENATDQARSDNVFRFSSGNSAVEVQVGSIHSVKGETHTATLVLDTFYRTHHLKALKGWLTGDRSGGGKEAAAMQSRMRLHYVALSRPSHLLCLAIPQDALTAADVRKVIGRGWRVGRVTDSRIEWRTRCADDQSRL